MKLCDTMVHINETLDPAARNTLEEQLRKVPGVIAPRFAPGREHLLLISYNSTQTDTHTLLETVRQPGYNAQLVGL